MMTESATPEGTTTVRSSSRKGLANSVLGTRNLMMTAALAVVSLILVIPLNYVGGPLMATPGGIMIGCVTMGLWVIPYLLPAVVVRRPGAVMIAALIIGVISIFTTPYGPSAIVGNLLGGLFIEAPLAIMLYRKWTWWAYLICAAVFGLLNGFLYASVLSTLGSADLIPVGVVTSVVSALAGGGICILLAHLLHRAGIAIDHDA